MVTREEMQRSAEMMASAMATASKRLHETATATENAAALLDEFVAKFREMVEGAEVEEEIPEAGVE